MFKIKKAAPLDDQITFKNKFFTCFNSNSRNFSSKILLKEVGKMIECEGYASRYIINAILVQANGVV